MEVFMRGRFVKSGLMMLAAVFLTGILAGPGCVKKVSYEDVLRENAAVMNRKCPIMVEKDVRLDSTSAGPGKRFTYYYTMTAQTRDSIDVISFEERLRPGLTNNLRTNASLDIIRKNRADVNYRFFDRKGRLILGIGVKAEEYLR
jgi:hypothetical protein